MVPWFLMALYPIAGDWRKASAGDAAYGYNMQAVLLPRSPKRGGNGVFFSPVLPSPHHTRSQNSHLRTERVYYYRKSSGDPPTREQRRRRRMKN